MKKPGLYDWTVITLVLVAYAIASTLDYRAAVGLP
jgi:hypothetical protein